MNNKKVIATLVISLVIISSIVGTTIAILTSTDRVKNKLTLGEIDTEVTENFTPPDNWDGSEYKKEVSVKNTTKGNPALIRVNISSRWVLERNGKEIPWSGDVSEKVVKLNFQNVVTKKENNSWSENKWLKSSDGYYYYTSVLPPQQTTSKILESVKVEINNNTVENPDIYIDKILKVDINVESVQPTKGIYEETWNINSSYNDTNVIDLLKTLTN